MSLRYKQNNMRVRVKRLSGSPLSLSDSVSTVCFSAPQKKQYIFYVSGRSDLFISNRKRKKKSPIFVITCRLCTCGYVLFVLPLSLSFQAPSPRAVQVYQAHWRHSNRSINLAKQCVWSIRAIPSGHTHTHTRANRQSALCVFVSLLWQEVSEVTLRLCCLCCASLLFLISRAISVGLELFLSPHFGGIKMCVCPTARRNVYLNGPRWQLCVTPPSVLFQII